jgi:hypothetical protein
MARRLTRRRRSEAPFRLLILPEPKVLVGYGQVFTHPRDGLFLAGPLTTTRQPKEIEIGAIGTTIGLELFRQFCLKIRGFIAPRPNDKAGPGLHRQAWPGFRAAFSCEWPEEPRARVPISEDKLRHAIRAMFHHEAVHDVASLLENSITSYLTQNELDPKVWFLIIPDDTFRYGRTEKQPPKKERHSGKLTFGEVTGRQILRHGALLPDDYEVAQVFRYKPDLHNQLKARLLQGHQRPIVQFMREKTLQSFLAADGTWEARHSSDPTEVAWNLCSSVFYKATGKPWQLHSIRPGVCYVGVVFKKDRTDTDPENACCAAQMFLDSGDGVVFKGTDGPYYSPTTKEFHLTALRAEELIRTVVESYKANHDGQSPKELFIHGRTRFNEVEFEGFKRGVGIETKVVAIRIRDDRGLKLFRLGEYPVLRGTALLLSKRNGYLWTRGTVAHLRTCLGGEVPNPLHVEIVQGDAELETVLADVLALTKVNFNGCMLGDGLPVTLRFADAVGEILTSAPIQPKSPWAFKHYI